MSEHLPAQPSNITSVYALGSNSSYQLSLPHYDDVSTPTKTTLVLANEEYPVKIRAGGSHTLLLTNKGSLYSTGGNKYGQCLKPACEFVPGFTKVDGIWTDFAATWEGTIAIDNKGLVWSFGKIKNHKNLSGWRPSNENAEVTRVAGGVQHFVVLTTKGAYGFGESRKGQIGVSHNEEPSLLSSSIIQAACGKDFTCLLSDNGTLEVHTTSSKHNLNSIPTHSAIHTLVASWSTIALLSHDGKVISWGRSDHGQFPPEDLPPMRQLAAGSEHFIALSEDNRVYAWGWNEHGNCGREDKEDVTTVHELVIPRRERAMFVAAGCGTSWIWTEKVD